MKKAALFAALALFLLAGAAQAHTPKGGLGDAAMSPDGKKLVVGGDTRVLYVLDPATLKVTDRVWLQTNIYEMEFNKDGSVLVVEDTSETLYFLSTSNWEISKKVYKAGRFSAAPQADLLAGFESGWKKSTVKVLSMNDGQEKAKLETEAKVLAVGLSPDATRLMVISEGPKDAEPKENPPKELRNLERDTFRQKHDGKVSVVTEYEVPSMKKLSEHTVFYTPHNAKAVVYQNGVCIVLTYDNVNARIADGQVTLFQSENSFNYGAGAAGNSTVMLSGGLRKGTYYNLSQEMKTTPFTINSLPGWPEYFEGFGVGPDGTGYGVTSAYRLVVVRPDGTVDRVVPIY